MIWLAAQALIELIFLPVTYEQPEALERQKVAA